ncbi:Cytosine deaminase [Colletotrichum sp. SAR11_240]|nr:Cytosine deaminase [Colletotrichum sp. SAR11_240]
MNDAEGLAIAIEEAKIGASEGGVPIGAALVSADDALFNSGRLPGKAYKGSTMYTTLSPCDMCTGACLLYGISRVVIGENKTFLGGEEYLKQRGVGVVVVDNAECKSLMDKFIAEKPEVWNEDIGEE